MIDVGQTLKKDLMQVIADAATAELNNRKIPKENRESSAKSLIKDYTTINWAKGDTLSGIIKNAGEAKASSNKKALIAFFSGMAATALCVGAAVIKNIHPARNLLDTLICANHDIVFKVSLLPMMIGGLVGTVYQSIGVIKHAKKEATAEKWKNFLIENQAEKDKALKKGIESIPEADSVTVPG